MEYQKFEKLQKQWNGKICLFGAGLIGKTWGYDIICLAGFCIDFYCDNNVQEGTIIRDGLKILSPEKLYMYKDNVLVFITVNIKYQNEIRQQLLDNGIEHTLVIDYLFLQKFCESVMDSKDTLLIRKYRAVVNDEEYLKRQFKYKCGYSLDLKEPKTFNEKLQWLKLNDRNERYIQMVDKLAVKKYVGEKIGYQYIIPTIGVWDKAEDIDFDSLPDKFVLKCTHDSGGVVIVNNKNTINVNAVKEKLKGCLEKNFYYYGREWPYKNVKKRIIAEKYMVDESENELKDYKIFAFNGCAKIIQVDFDRFGVHRRNLYSKEWTYIPAMIKYPTDPEVKIGKPIQLKKMLEFAEMLSKNIAHVRVDFYSIRNKIYFGELTFYHGAGFEKFVPEEIGLMFGEWIKLSPFPEV